MIIDMLTRWLNFEFGVLSHLKTVSLQPIAMQTIRWWRHLVINVRKHRHIWFIPMMAPPSDQGKQPSQPSLGSWSRLPKTMSSAWKFLPSPHFSYTYKAQNIILNYSRCFTCQITCILYQTLLLWQPPDAPTFDLSIWVTRDATHSGRDRMRYNLNIWSLYFLHTCFYTLWTWRRALKLARSISQFHVVFLRGVADILLLVAFQSEWFPLASASRCAISKSLGHVRPLRLGDIYISAAGNSIAVHDWPLFISPRLQQPDSSWVIVCASR